VVALGLPSRRATPRGANAPRSCGGTRISAGEKTIFTLHIRTPDQERRALARRAESRVGRRRASCRRRLLRCTYAHPRNRTLCREYHALFTDHATHKQERRASARRGNETHTQRRLAFADGSRFVPQIRLPAPRLAHASRSYLKTRMLLVICVSYLRVRYSLHGWLTPAAPGCATCVRRKIRHLCCTPEQERRASARRGSHSAAPAVHSK
jgi:hypothetical protein